MNKVRQQAMPAIVVVMVIFCLIKAFDAYAADSPKVLVLHSYHSGFQWTDDQNAAIITSLLAAYPEGDVFVEYMNTKRVALDVMSPMLRRNYATLFRKAQPDVIITTDNNALDFLLEYGDELFPGVPVVFCGINNFDDYNLGNRPNYTGVREDFDTAATLDIMLRFHPDTHTVAMIADVTESSRITLAIAMEAAKKYEKVRFIELSGLSDSDLAERLEKLEKGAIILLLSYYRSPDGRVFSVKDGVQLIQEHTRLPVYALWDFYMLPPVIGGKIVTGTLQGKAAAEIAVRILQGEKPEAIPPYSCPTSYYFNYDALQKFSIPDSLIPADSIIAGKPDTFYARYKIYIRVGAAFALSLIVTILILLRSIVLQRRNKKALRKLNRELQAIRNCDQILIRATDEQTLLKEICRIICNKAGYWMAWVGYRVFDDAKSVRAVAWAGVEDGYLADAGIAWDDSERGGGPTGTAIRSGESACIQDFATDPRAAQWRDRALQRGYRSSIALPLKDEDQNTFGALNIHAAEPDAFTAEEKRLLEDLAGDLEFGIMVLRARIERKRAEEALRESRQLLDNIVANSPGAIYRCANTPEWPMEFLSAAITRITGYPADDFLGNRIRSYAGIIHPDDRRAVEDAVADGLKRKDRYDMDYRLAAADGTLRWVHEQGRGVFSPDGQLLCLDGVIVDITAHRQAEEEIRKLNEELEQRVRERTAELEAKNRELERINGLFVGRELKMVELKGRIAVLENQNRGM